MSKFSDGKIVKPTKTDDVPCTINLVEWYFNESQYIKVGLLLGKSEEQLKKEFALMAKMEL